MSLSMTIFTFLNAWWISLFMVLPLSIERGERSSELEYAAAPKRIHWRRIMVVTTLLAVFFTAALALLIKSGIIPVRDTLQ
jgi:predicted secreted protein